MSLNVPMVLDIERETLNNQWYRRVINTSQHMQLVLMSISPGEEIGLESHHGTQFIRVESGNGLVMLNGSYHILEPNTAVFIPAGTKHNVVNTGVAPLDLYTLYSPPEHAYDAIEYQKPLA